MGGFFIFKNNLLTPQFIIDSMTKPTDSGGGHQLGASKRVVGCGGHP